VWLDNYPHNNHIWFFIEHWKSIKSVSTKDRKQHTESLNNKVYTKLVDVWAQEENSHSLILVVPKDYEEYHPFINLGDLTGRSSLRDYIVVSKLEYFEHAISHLKHRKYARIYKPWKKANILLGKYNKLVNTIITSLEECIRTELGKAYPTFVETREDNLSLQNCYHMSNISAILFHSLYSSVQTGTSTNFNNKLEILQHTIHDGYSIIIEDYTRLTLIKSTKQDELKPDALQGVLISICNNADIIQKFSKLNGARKEIDDILSKEFSEKLKLLVSDIRIGHIIKGKCRIEY
jgi:hypothetical protein